MQPSQRSRISPFLAMDVLREANAREAAGGTVLHMELGEPGGGAPPSVIEAATRCLRERPVGYTNAFGIGELREGIADLYRRWHGTTVATERIAVTAGASGGFVLAFLAAFDKGDRVAVADPSYPCYRNTLEALGIEVVRMEAKLENGFQPTLAELDALVVREGAIDGLVIASPANPTGSMIGDDDLAAIAHWCDAQDARLVADEIYHGITYERPATTVLRHTDNAIVVNSFSKFFAMTGWRIGWLVLPADLTAAVERLGQNLYISASAIGQHAAIAALKAEAELRPRVDIYRKHRDLVLASLARAGIDRIAPAEGAFYAYADIGRYSDDSIGFCSRLLADTGIAITPGVDFDPVRGHRFVRFSFAGETGQIERACAQFETWIRTFGR
ncbi:MAG: aminotransferase class I/II-fold pyridoxal phosphate-dependent enzyme [Geminicoccaceae bacterium]